MEYHPRLVLRYLYGVVDLFDFVVLVQIGFTVVFCVVMVYSYGSCTVTYNEHLKAFFKKFYMYKVKRGNINLANALFST